jgi:hypothetical protein
VIVLRVSVGDREIQVRSAGRRVVLGSGPGADVMVSDAGWSAQEAILEHAGTEVVLERAGASRDLRLRVGDEIVLGSARVGLLGILPLGAAEAGAAAGVPVFGGYDDHLPAADGRPFRLEGEARGGRGAGTTRASRPRGSASPPPLAKPKPTGKPADRTKPTDAEPATSAASAPAAPAARKGQAPRPKTPITGLHSPDFGQEILLQLKRAPFFVISLAIHAVTLLVLTIFFSERTPGALDGDRDSLRASVSPLLEQDAEEREEPDFLDPMRDLQMPEIEDPILEEEKPDETTADEGRAEDLAELPDLEETPLMVGLNPSITSARRRTGPPRERPPPVDFQEDFQKADSTGANQRAADYVRSQLGMGRGGRGDPFEPLVRRDILVVEGSFDKVSRVIDALRLPYVQVPAYSVSLPNAPDLSQHKIVFWNCGESLPPSQRRMAARRIRNFVQGGGYLFSTDWAVGNLLAEAFPGYLETKGPRAPLPEMVVGIRPATGQERHPLLQGVFRPNVDGKWWLEQASFDVSVRKPREVEVLIESPDLESLFQRSPAVAVTFPYGRGRVLHVVGHYFQEAGNLAGTVSAHRLALNFVLMRLGEDAKEED